MLCSSNNSEKMIISSSTTTNTNEWSQRDENTGILMASNGNNNDRVMEKTAIQEQQQQQQQQQQQPHLKCPRCDSSNTKFCYYNNYSLTQPRHFCKACKRYWTRGGTLRNVPVGGGYRKNKRVKRPATASNNDTASSILTTTTSSAAHHHINVSNNPNQMISPLFYGLPTNQSSYMNLSFPGYDQHHQSQLSSTGLSYPSIAAMTSNNQPHEDYGVGVGYNRTTQVQDLINSSSNSLSSFSLFGSSSPSPRISAMMMFHGTNKESRNNRTTYHQGLLPFQDLQMGMNDDNPRMSKKEVKNEDGNNHSSNNEIGNNKVEWNNLPCQNQVGAADSSLFWNSNMTSTVGTWPDLANYGSSVTSLI